MKPNTRAVLDLCIQRGVAAGIRRAYKHTDKPNDSEIEAYVQDAIWQEISELFDMEDVNEFVA